MRRSPVWVALALLTLLLLVALLVWRDAPAAGVPVAQARCVGAAPHLGEAKDGQRVLLYHDFTRNDAHRLTHNTENQVRYASDNGAYLIDAAAPGLLAWSRLRGRYGDGLIEVSAAQVAGSAVAASGLLFRYQDDNNFYLFTVAHNGFYNLTQIVDGTPRVLIDWTPSPLIAGPGLRNPAWNRLGVALHQDQITLFVNQQRLDTTLEASWQRGGAGLVVQTFAAGAAVCFDNLRISAPAQP